MEIFSLFIDNRRASRSASEDNKDVQQSSHVEISTSREVSEDDSTLRDDDDAYWSMHLKKSSKLIINSLHSLIGELHLSREQGDGTTSTRWDYVQEINLRGKDHCLDL